jgi:putative ABC transport system substrate-binding protein
MRRREFIGLIGSSITWLSAVRAQEAGRIYRIGFLMPMARNAPPIVAFFEELKAHGYVEGKNLTVLPGGFQVRSDQVADLVPSLIRAEPDVVLSGGDVNTRAALQATRTIPIVVITEDMIAAGFAASLARPGANITGVSLMSLDLDGKRQDILIEATPNIRRIAVLADPNVASLQHLDALQKSASSRDREVIVVRVAKADDLVIAINEARALGAGALNVLASPLLFQYRSVILARAAELKMPAIYQWPDTAEEGGLLGYGPRIVEVIRQRSLTVAKILAGAKPADIPVEQPTTFELAINLKTAKVIGHEMPAGLVLRADKLIE